MGIDSRFKKVGATTPDLKEALEMIGWTLVRDGPLETKRYRIINHMGEPTVWVVRHDQLEIAPSGLCKGLFGVEAGKYGESGNYFQDLRKSYIEVVDDAVFLGVQDDVAILSFYNHTRPLEPRLDDGDHS